MNKVVRDGKVAVLISVDYGLGWSTENYAFRNELLFDPVVVEIVLKWAEDSNTLRGDAYDVAYEQYHKSVEDHVNKEYQGLVSTGGISGLMVEWVPMGERFYIRDYDGAESLVLESQMNWYTA